ncbi:hypothetical protein [Microbacterium kribbense]|uniref:hypothetical protein n=1 Tax=Microbacterium kribbense TaxID=433645 RepID=UPI0031E37359
MGEGMRLSSRGAHPVDLCPDVSVLTPTLLDPCRADALLALHDDLLDQRVRWE